MRKLLGIWLLSVLALQGQKIEEVSMPPSTGEEAMYLFLAWKNEQLANASVHLNYEDALMQYAEDHDTLALVLLLEARQNAPQESLYKTVKKGALLSDVFISNLVLTHFFKQEQFTLMQEHHAFMEKQQQNLSLSNLYHLRSFYIQFEKEDALTGLLWNLWVQTQYSEPIFDDLIALYQKRSALFEMLEELERFPVAVQSQYQELLYWKAYEWSSLKVFWEEHQCQNPALDMAYRLYQGDLKYFDRNWFYYDALQAKKEAKSLWLWAQFCKKEGVYCSLVPEAFNVGTCDQGMNDALEEMEPEVLFQYLKNKIVQGNEIEVHRLKVLAELYPLDVKVQAVLYALNLIETSAWEEVAIYAIDHQDEALVKYFQEGSSEMHFLVLDLCKFWKEKNKESIRKQLAKY